MSLTRRDAAATVLAVVVALVYLSNTHDWGVPLLASNRWAAGAILVVGMAMCFLGRPADEGATFGVFVLGALGVAALALAISALWTNEQWALALLALVTLVLWAASTVRHAVLPAARPPHPA